MTDLMFPIQVDTGTPSGGRPCFQAGSVMLSRSDNYNARLHVQLSTQVHFSDGLSAK